MDINSKEHSNCVNIRCRSIKECKRNSGQMTIVKWPAVKQIKKVIKQHVEIAGYYTSTVTIMERGYDKNAKNIRDNH